MAENIYLPVRIIQSNRATEEETNDILQKINKHTLEPINSLDDVYYFEGDCSNDRLDAYSTKMDPNTTLRNYETNLKEGVALLPNHDVSKTPYGRSYDGAMNIGGDLTSVRGYWYLLRNTVVNGENTNDTIRSIKAGIMRDLSVGFGGNEMWYRCSSCNRSLWDYECNHFPGLEDESGERTFAWVVDAHLREVSTVYKGATPGSAISGISRSYIDKAQEYAQQGQLSEKQILQLESAYSIRLDANKKRSFYVPKNENQNKTKEGYSMNDNKNDVFSVNELLENIRYAVRENKIEKGRIYDILTIEGEPFRQPEDIALRNELGRDHCKPDAIRQLKKEAQQGRRYLADMVDGAVAARLKAQGDTFNPENYRNMLNITGDIDSIKEEIEAYNRQAKLRFSAGRQTDEEPLNRDNQPNEPEKPVKIDPNENFFEGSDE